MVKKWPIVKDTYLSNFELKLILNRLISIKDINIKIKK